MNKIKTILGITLGLFIFGFLSFYQPVFTTDVFASTHKPKIQNMKFSFISPIPFDQLVTNN